MTERPTTSAGPPVADNPHSLTAGPNRERMPGRVMRA